MRRHPRFGLLRSLMLAAGFCLLVVACGSEPGTDADATAEGAGLQLATDDTTETEQQEPLVVEPKAVIAPPDRDDDAAADGSPEESDTSSDTSTDSEADSPAETASSSDSGEVVDPAPTAVSFPDCSGGCNYVMEGDSITFGLIQWLWPKFCTDVGAATCINSGISGHRIDQMIETARGDVDVHLGSGDNDVLIFWGGTNDLWQKFHSEDPALGAAGAYQSTIDYIAERRANGWDYVIILTHPPMNPGVVQGWEQLNDLIRENEAGADTIIDVGPDPQLADPFDPVMRAPDGVHYKDPGRQVVVEQYLIPAVLELQAG